MAGTEEADSESRRSAEIGDSARGWHQIQLAVLGFVGLCGVLQRGRPENPMWLQTLVGLLVVGALLTALAAIFIVARVAWPPAGVPARSAGHLRAGIALTFVAVGMLALGGASMWWPENRQTGENVEIHAADGRAWYGRLTTGRDGALSVQTDAGAVVLALRDVAALRPVDSCD
jgi:hypothetical protein